MAQFGRGILGDVSTKLIDQFAQNLNTMIDEDGVDDASDDASGDDTAEIPAATETADAPIETPKVRKIDGPAAEPIDLMDVSGTSILKRAAPAIAALLIILFFLRRRS